MNKTAAVLTRALKQLRPTTSKVLEKTNPPTGLHIVPVSRVGNATATTNLNPITTSHSGTINLAPATSVPRSEQPTSALFTDSLDTVSPKEKLRAWKTYAALARQDAKLDTINQFNAKNKADLVALLARHNQAPTKTEAGIKFKTRAGQDKLEQHANQDWFQQAMANPVKRAELFKAYNPRRHSLQDSLKTKGSGFTYGSLAVPAGVVAGTSQGFITR